MKEWKDRSCYLAAEFLYALSRHERWLLLLVTLLLGLLGLNMFYGELKPYSQWDWVDIAGEGVAAALVLFWLLIIFSIRPKGRVTNYFAIGLIGIIISFTQDLLDEFFQLKNMSWDSWIESTPLGLLLLTIAFWLWRAEQLQINLYLHKRKLLQSRPKALDSALHIPDFSYLQEQLFIQARDRLFWPSTALLFLEIEAFNDVSHRYNGPEVDRLLLLVTELLLLGLRPQDVLCRYAGQRFAVLLNGVSPQEAAEVEVELKRAIDNFTFRTKDGEETISLSVVTGLAQAQMADSSTQAVHALLAEAKLALYDA